MDTRKPVPPGNPARGRESAAASGVALAARARAARSSAARHPGGSHLRRERHAGPPLELLPAGESGVVVLDFSTSIDQPGYRRISNVLRPVVEANQPIGIVYFSDVAYVALPPGTPGRELRPFLRFLRTPAPPGQFPTRADLDRAVRFQPLENPWAAAFRGGTRISKGLEVAREMVEREQIEGTVLLISDLDDSLFDVPELGATLARFRRDRIDLRVVPLFPSDDDRAFFREALGQRAFVTHAELLRNRRRREAVAPGRLPTAAAPARRGPDRARRAERAVLRPARVAPSRAAEVRA